MFVVSSEESVLLEQIAPRGFSGENLIGDFASPLKLILNDIFAGLGNIVRRTHAGKRRGDDGHQVLLVSRVDGRIPYFETLALLSRFGLLNVLQHDWCRPLPISNDEEEPVDKGSTHRVGIELTDPSDKHSPSDSAGITNDVCIDGSSLRP